MRRSRRFLYTLALAGGVVTAGAVVGLSLHALAGPLRADAFNPLSASRATRGQSGRLPAVPVQQLSWSGEYGVPPTRTTDDYQYDDGSSEQAIGLTAGGEFCWMHQFNTIAGAETIVAVSTAWGTPAFPGSSPPNGTAARVFVWDDVNNDGDPSDAVLLAQENVVVANAETDILNKYALTTPVTVSGSFFIGASVVHASGQFPGPQDTTTPYGGQAWAAGDGTAFDPTNLPANDLPPVEISTAGFPGYWLLRANATAGIVVFDQKGPFEDFMLSQGKLLKGLEDFEPPVSNVPPGGIAGPLADPLEGNVPNVDGAGLGFPNGLANKNLVMASNQFTQNPPPGPIGSQFGSGLVAVGQGFWVSPDIPNSVKVGANAFVESTDLFFDPAENHTGVGFTLEELLGGQPVHITVFNKSDQVIWKEVLTVPTAAKAFFGIWSPETIGRINVGGPGAELVDDIQMWFEVPPVTKFTDKGAFEDFMRSQGKLLKGLEDFEPPVSNVPPGALASLTDPLVGNVPNVDPSSGFGFPNGLANKNLLMASNQFEENPPPGPPGSQFGGGLVALGPDFGGPGLPNSVKVGANQFAQSTDLYFDPAENHTGVGFTLEEFVGQGLVHITIFNKNDQVIWKDVVTVPTPGKAFLGIWSPQTIGRINIGGPGGELVDDIQMWFERPPQKCADLDGDGDVDGDDFGIFAACYGGANNPPAASCPPGVNADLDNDGDVDGDDFGIFAACYNGANNPPAAGCPLGC